MTKASIAAVALLLAIAAGLIASQLPELPGPVPAAAPIIKCVCKVRTVLESVDGGSQSWTVWAHCRDLELRISTTDPEMVKALPVGRRLFVTAQPLPK